MTQSKPSPTLSADQLQSWLDAYQDNQRQIIQAHQDYQRALKDGLDSFLETMAHTQAQLARVIQHLGVEEQLAETTTPQPTPVTTARKTPTQSVQTPPAPKVVPAPQNQTPTASNTNMADELLQTVADKTGYPKEMLELDMTLEEDLGIDSIKRVEILSALRDKAPHLPEVNADHMAQLRTLGDIVSFMKETSNALAAPNFF